MQLKLFFKDHISLFVLQFVQFAIVIALLLLAGFRDWHLMLYSFLLFSFFLGCYLTYYYVTRRQFYKQLTMQLEELDDVIREMDHTYISERLGETLIQQYSLYKREIASLQKDKEDHFIFIDRWIHQMKTPLSVLELMAQDLDEPQSTHFREEIDRLKTGLHMVLYMARLRTIESDFHIKQVNVLDVLQEVKQDNKRLFIQHRVYPNVESESETTTVETDEKWLYFILTQLIQNAVKYTDRRSDQIDIRIEKAIGRTVISVQDYGVGIPAHDMKRIFDPFYTGDNGRLFRESTGVGLCLVKEVSNYLGHHIEVESEVDRGTTFTLTVAS